jgi:hypothetical protein
MTMFWDNRRVSHSSRLARALLRVAWTAAGSNGTYPSLHEGRAGRMLTPSRVRSLNRLAGALAGPYVTIVEATPSTPAASGIRLRWRCRIANASVIRNQQYIW